MRALAILLMTFGFLLIVLSPLWPSVAESSLFWDDVRARNFAETVGDLHQAHVQASIEHDRLWSDDAGAAKAAHADALENRTRPIQERFDEDQRKLVNARRLRNQGGSVMRWLGVGVAVIGIGIFQWHKSASE